jgi:hypothetical protein
MERERQEKQKKQLEKEKAEAEKAKSGADGKVYTARLGYSQFLLDSMA